MKAFLIGAGDYHGEGRDLITEDDLVIAVDGGLLHCQSFGLTPALAIGDFDSLGYLPKGVEAFTHPVEKDDTDMALAVDVALTRGAREIYLLGALGGRLDHTLANITLLRSLAERGTLAYVIGERESMTVLRAGESALFEGSPDGVFSLFSLTEKSTVTITGAKYPLSSGDIFANRALGVSNHFMKRSAEIIIESGTVLLLWENSESNELIRLT